MSYESVFLLNSQDDTALVVWWQSFDDTYRIGHEMTAWGYGHSAITLLPKCWEWVWHKD